MSLAHSFDVKEPQDFLRGLSNALSEFDQSKEDGERPKMVCAIGFASYLIADMNPQAFAIQVREAKTTTGRDGLRDIVHRFPGDVLSYNAPCGASSV